MKEGFRSGAWIAALVFSMAGCASAPTAEDTPPPAPAPVVEPQPEPPAIRDNAPVTYVVKKGDTLWDIASTFLASPWRWPEVWHVNPQVRNPHLIYPGDVLVLSYVDGKPRIQVQGGVRDGLPPTDLPVVKLSPRVRVEPLERAIPTIPYDAISQFLIRPRVVTLEELERAPYVVSAQAEHLIGSPGYPVFVRGLGETDLKNFNVVRLGEAYVNPDDKDDILGYEAIRVADARVQRLGDPATVLLQNATRETLAGDRLLPATDGFVEQNYLPHAPAHEVEGRIVGAMGAVSQIGQFQVVVISKGARDDMEPGHVLAVYQAGGIARDPIAREEVRLPRERAGTLMLFRVFDRVSYALVMDATRAIHMHDVVTNP
ncbi:MAG: LysM peptidoglycan-binding domain-containing protein [Thiohalomonadaceae bacterium]